MIKAIIFDLDGTLLNTIDDITNALNNTLKRYRYPTKSIEETKLNLGSGSIHLVKESLPKGVSEEEFKNIHRDYQEYYMKNNNILTNPYPGIIELLEELKENGYLLAVVSNKDDHDVKMLNKDKFKGLIEIAIGARKGEPVKPDPHLIKIALKKLNLKSEEVIYVGDSDVDILTANNANIKMITVSWGFRPYEVLLKYQATNIINHPNELIDKVEKINDQITRC